MKKTVIAIIIALIPVIVAFYLTREQADVRYSLSEKIPADYFDEVSSENIQLLDIINVGNIEAKDLLIIISGKLTKYKLQKPSELIQTKELHDPNKLEISFSAFPAQSKIKLTLKSPTNISDSDIQIRHSKGIGKGVLSKGFPYSKEIFFAILFFYIFGYFFYLFISHKKDQLERYSESSYNHNEVLKRTKKPFYIRENKWKQLRVNALKTKITAVESRGHRNIERTNSYIALSSDKPDYLDDEEWKKLLHEATDRFKAIYKTGLSDVYYNERIILQLMQISKPNHLPDADWEELINEARKAYLSSIRGQSMSTDEVISKLSAARPEALSYSCYEENIKYLSELYYRRLSIELDWSINPIEYLESRNLNILSHDYKEKIIEHAYRLQLARTKSNLSSKTAQDILDSPKPSWMKDSDYKDIKEIAELIVESKKTCG